ncbi:helix-turn-helix domain-containing protein [Streptococcus azizii]|uniref:Helix-turn-helix domain-containing protein n=1 Tax=Streptococcus azizii TaxID=1579424 RepID=A0AB36JR84_9STRE|nr:helix-turn-helix domain-containing protein [Streptococcus azizii]ONK25705.1 hypothetical protein BVE86_09350 [Streptococcus azizii]
MEDVFEPIKRKLEAIASGIFAEKSKYFNVENAFPAILTKEQLKKMLGCGNTELERYVNARGFPIIRAKGKQDRFPRDAVRDFLRHHWQEIV